MINNIKMTGNILNGKRVAQEWKDFIRNDILYNKYKPCLAIITDGCDPASKIYIKQKKAACEYCGIEVRIYEVANDFRDTYETIQKLNIDDSVHGIIVQLPLKPTEWNGWGTDLILNSIDPMKDVDGLGSNMYFNPCTPFGIIHLLDEYGIPIAGQKVVIINRSKLVGRPLAKMLLDRDATVTVCHSKTDKEALEYYIQDADIIVSAVGNGKFQIGPTFINNGQVLIDVAMNRDGNGKFYGDFHPKCYEKCAYYTPVPGGIGPMTVATLMSNTRMAYLYNEGLIGKNDI